MSLLSTNSHRVVLRCPVLAPAIMLVSANFHASERFHRRADDAQQQFKSCFSKASPLNLEVLRVFFGIRLLPELISPSNSILINTPGVIFDLLPPVDQ